MAAEDNCSKRHSLATRMAAWILLTIHLAACGILQPLEIHKVALLAPFEGPFREFGYNALYAARLAMSDENLENVQLLPIDDGGNIMSAAARIRALNLDSAVIAIIALGEAATHPSAQRSNDKPIILIGNWGHDRADDDSLYATSRERAILGTQDDLLIALQMVNGYHVTPTTHFTSNGLLADVEFVARYIESGQHTSKPNWLATLTYDLTRLVLISIRDGRALSRVSVDGLNGEISFDDGYWNEAPIHQYQFEGSVLALSSG